MAEFLRNLQRMADEFDIAVVITNQVTDFVDGGNRQPASDAKKPIGGQTMAHPIQTRLSLSRCRGETRICKMYHSPSQIEREVFFAITQRGIEDFQ